MTLSTPSVETITEIIHKEVLVHPQDDVIPEGTKRIYTKFICMRDNDHFNNAKISEMILVLKYYSDRFWALNVSKIDPGKGEYVQYDIYAYCFTHRWWWW